MNIKKIFFAFLIMSSTLTPFAVQAGGMNDKELTTVVGVAGAAILAVGGVMAIGTGAVIGAVAGSIYGGATEGIGGAVVGAVGGAVTGGGFIFITLAALCKMFEGGSKEDTHNKN